MKFKNILLFLLVIFLCPITVNAEENDHDWMYDDVYCTSGGVTHNHNMKNGSSEWIYNDTYEVTSTTSGGFIYLVKKKSTLSGRDYDFYLCGKGSCSVKTTKESHVVGKDSGNPTVSTSTKSLSSFLTQSSGTGYIMFNTYPDTATGTNHYLSIYECDIPIFNAEDLDGIKLYEDEQKTDNAENEPDYTEDYDESIPVPHNLKVLKGVDQTVLNGPSKFITRYWHDVVLSWEQSEVSDMADLSFEIEAIYYYKRADESGLVPDPTDLKVYNQHATLVQDKYDTTSFYPTVNLSNKILRAPTGIQTKLVLRIRNKRGHKTSAWVKVTIDLEKQTATADVENPYDNDEEVDDPEYDNTNANADTNTTNGGGTLSNDSILSYIRDGFGLLGANGILSLMAKAFIYLPASIWTILKFYVAMLVAIAIIAVVKELIF